MGYLEMNYTKQVPKDIAEKLTKILGKGWDVRGSGNSGSGKFPSIMWCVWQGPVQDYAHWVATFHLEQLSGCCGMALSYHASVYPNFRKKGIGALLNSLRIHMAREAGYGCLMCTDVEDNTYQRKILAKNGWKDTHKFVNPRTGNTILVSVIDL